MMVTIAQHENEKRGRIMGGNQWRNIHSCKAKVDVQVLFLVPSGNRFYVRTSLAFGDANHSAPSKYPPEIWQFVKQDSQNDLIGLIDSGFYVSDKRVLSDILCREKTHIVYEGESFSFINPINQRNKLALKEQQSRIYIYRMNKQTKDRIHIFDHELCV